MSDYDSDFDELNNYIINSQILIKNLGDFFKHCLNVGLYIRTDNQNVPLWFGWMMRCRIKPYLVNNVLEINDPNQFKDDLLYTLKDYYEYCEIFRKIKNKNKEKIEYLIDYINTTPSDELVEEINNNAEYFPDIIETTHFYVLKEDFNNFVKRGRKYKDNLKPEN
jgi:hypothetical protein